MHKLVTAGLVALGLLAAGQPASAWINCHIGVGLDVKFQCGGHCCPWGLYDNGPLPWGDGFIPPHGHVPPAPPWAHHGVPMIPPMPLTPMPQPSPPFGFEAPFFWYLD